ncbi:MAG: serine hydrolase domain-containing protein [Anaerolineae bacterium]
MTAIRIRPEQLDGAVAAMRAGVAAGDAAESVLAVANSRDTIRVEVAAPDDSTAALADDSIFLLASITKTFFGTAIMQLVEQGRLMLTDTVARHVPEFARYDKAGITVWNLLTHTSGMADESDSAAWEAGLPPAAHVEAACRAFTHFAPGTEYEYCNLSFWMLGEIIARLSGLAYPEYLHQRILDPLGMGDTSFAPQGDQDKRFVPVRQGESSEMPPADYFMSLALPAGGLCSSARDLVRYGQAMLRGLRGEDNGVIGRAAIATMTRRQTGGIRERGSSHEADYALGWGKPGPMHLGTPAAFGHGGATATLLWIEPDYDLVYVYLTNVFKDNRVARLALNALLARL